MILRTKVRDCLYLNWALPGDALPALPEPLRYQRVVEGEREWVFASALLFHHEGLRLRALPFVRLSYPQLHLRVYVLDGEGRPGVFLRRILVPLWALPGVRLLGRHPARPGRLDFARPSEEPDAGPWRWSVESDGGLDLVAERAAPRAGEGPSLGCWEDTVRFFRERHRAYAGSAGSLRRMETTQPEAVVWPVRVDFAVDGLVRDGLGWEGEEALPELHSAWLCPEIPMTFELLPEAEPEEPVRRSVPAAG